MRSTQHIMKRSKEEDTTQSGPDEVHSQPTHGKGQSVEHALNAQQSALTLSSSPPYPAPAPRRLFAVNTSREAARHTKAQNRNQAAEHKQNKEHVTSQSSHFKTNETLSPKHWQVAKHRRAGVLWAWRLSGTLRTYFLDSC